MPRKQTINLEDLLNKLENYNNDLKEILELEDKLNQERFLVRGEIEKIISDIDTKLKKIQNV